MEILRENQLDIMLVLIGICGVTSFFAGITAVLSKTRKRT